MAGIISDTSKLGGVPQSASRFVAMSTCFDVFLEGNVHIGFISQLTLGHTRTVTQIRHLNSVDAGIAVDTVMTPDTITLSYGGFYVYAKTSGTTGLLTNTSKRDVSTSNTNVGASGGRLAGISLLMTLDQQNIPFDIVVRHNMPGTSGFVTSPDTGGIIGVYKNCTLASMSVPIQLSAAALSDTGSISVGYVASSHS